MGASLESKPLGFIERMKLAKKVRKIAREHGLKSDPVFWGSMEGKGIVLSYEKLPEHGQLQVCVGKGLISNEFSQENFVSLVAAIHACVEASNGSRAPE